MAFFNNSTYGLRKLLPSFNNNLYIINSKTVYNHINNEH